MDMRMHRIVAASENTLKKMLKLSSTIMRWNSKPGWALYRSKETISALRQPINATAAGHRRLCASRSSTMISKIVAERTISGQK